MVMTSRADIVIVFDNNAYRDLVSDVLLGDVEHVVSALTEEQAAHGHIAVASPIVALELVARLRSPGSRGFDAAIRAIVALVRNCRDTTAVGSPIRMLQEPDANLCLALFGREPPDAKENLDRLTWLLKHVDQVRGTDLGPDGWELIGLIGNHVDAREQSFVADMFKHVVQPHNPGISNWDELMRRPDLAEQALGHLSSEQWLRTFARVQVLKAADTLSLSPSAEEVEERTTWLAPYLTTPHALYTEAVKRVLVDGARLTVNNRANWFWDIHILFGIGPEHATGGRSIVLVTSDGDMVAAASRSAAGSKVETYATYRSRLAQDPGPAAA
jgi:hypothetical protein